MSLYEKILEMKEKISVVGLGYVGMPIAIEFAKKALVIGFDINKEKIELYKKGVDPTLEVGDNVIQDSTIEFTYNENKLREAKFHIVAVPTPINSDKTPDLSPVINASKIVGRNLVSESIVVYESTVYPGVTEEVCIPILEKESGLRCGIDFKVGYSPERINPGDKEHTLTNIVKIVSGTDNIALNEISNVYKMIILAGVHKVSSIKAAESTKVVENSQRDVNIAFMNELAIIFDKMGIDTKEVVDAMNTKWNALKFTPGLVGGHCISVDPYYFIYKAENLGYHSQIILSGRKINDDMSAFVSNIIIKQLILAGKTVNKSKVAILGITFKENCPDIRNSKVYNIIQILSEYGISVNVVDPWADKAEVKKEYNVDLIDINEVNCVDCLIVAVAHSEFKRISQEQMERLFLSGDESKKIVIDIKALFDKDKLIDQGYIYWRL